MSPLPFSIAASIVFWVHVAIIAFNLFGLIAIPAGAWCEWDFVRVFWWRALHLSALALVALQAILGRACFLTLWENELLTSAGQAGSNVPLIQRWISQIIFWPLPLWVFAAAYVAIFAYTLALWWFVPPRLAPR